MKKFLEIFKIRQEDIKEIKEYIKEELDICRNETQVIVRDDLEKVIDKIYYDKALNIYNYDKIEDLWDTNHIIESDLFTEQEQVNIRKYILNNLGYEELDDYDDGDIPGLNRIREQLEQLIMDAIEEWQEEEIRKFDSEDKELKEKYKNKRNFITEYLKEGQIETNADIQFGSYKHWSSVPYIEINGKDKLFLAYTSTTINYSQYITTAGEWTYAELRRFLDHRI